MNEIRTLYLPRLLKWDDRNSMAFSIEGRYPFLDHELIELCLSFAPEILYRRGWTKWPLRRGLARRAAGESRSSTKQVWLLGASGSLAVRTGLRSALTRHGSIPIVPLWDRRGPRHNSEARRRHLARPGGAGSETGQATRSMLHAG